MSEDLMRPYPGRNLTEDKSQEDIYTLFHKIFSTFFWNKISLPERRNKGKCVLEITKMYYFKI